MRKVTIIAPSRYEALILTYLGNARLINFKTVPFSDYEGHEDLFEGQTSFREMLFALQKSYQDLIKIEPSFSVNPVSPGMKEIKEFAAEPERIKEKITKELLGVYSSILGKKEALNILNEKHKIAAEKIEKLFEEKLNVINTVFTERESELKGEQEKLYQEEFSLQTKLKSLQALDPEEFRQCFAACVMENENIESFKTYIKIKPDVNVKEANISDGERLLFLFGPKENTEWYESLFLLFEIQDVFDYIEPGDLLTVLDKERRQKRIEEYEKRIIKLQTDIAEKTITVRDIEEFEQRLSNIEAEKKRELEELNQSFSKKLVDVEESYKEEMDKLKKEHLELLEKASYYSLYVETYTSRAPILRSNILSVMQGWVPDNRLNDLDHIIDRVQNENSIQINYKVDRPSVNDGSVPTPEMKLKPGFLQPAGILTSLRGWPSYGEFNPSYLSLITFCIQFGLMYGDVGQGLIMSLIGVLLSKRFNRGMMYRLGGLLIPMGFSAIIFGFLYDSMFLLEGVFGKYVHYTPLLPNPMEHPTTMMKLVFLVAAIEVVIGLGVSIINHIREGNVIGIIGEHGIGFILYVIGLYMTAMYFISIGMNFTQALSNWTFYMVLVGLSLSLLGPILHSLLSGHGIGIEAIGEGIGGIMMTFVEGLANLFSFLRIVAFAIAHVSLSVAAHALTFALGQSLSIPILIVMNLIALTFEFVSSGVQSLRLLYYEFMGKFYKGTGTRWRPFILPQSNNIE